MPALASIPPRSLTVTLRVPAGILLAQEDVQAGVAALLFHDGKVSHKEACDLLGVGRREFDEVLAAHGFSPADRIDPDEEIAAAKDW
jgi:predicted HTH domain antitoxin